MEGLGRVHKPTISCEWFSASSIDLLMQTVNHDICCSALPQLSVMPSLISGDWQFLLFLKSSFTLTMCGILGPALLHLLTSSRFLFFFIFSDLHFLLPYHPSPHGDITVVMPLWLELIPYEPDPAAPGSFHIVPVSFHLQGLKPWCLTPFLFLPSCTQPMF